MTNTKKPATHQSFEERKKALIAQGAEQRAKVDASIAVIRTNLHANILAKNAMSAIASKATGAVSNLFGRHHADKVDLSTDLTPGMHVHGNDDGIAARIANLTNGDHAAGRMIATVRRFLPLATTAFTILRRRRMLMPVVRSAAVVGGVGAGAYFFYRHRQRAQEQAAIENQAMEYGYPIEATRPGVLDERGQLH